MSILCERTVWRKAGKQRSRKTTFALTPAEQVNVRAAIRALEKHMTRRELAAAIPCTVKSIENALAPRRKPGPGIAIRVAQLAGVPVEDVLSGAFPKAGHCPRCGWASIGTRRV